MGAYSFQERVDDEPDAKLAFWKAVDSAAYMHGHGGYSGTIAEKHEFTVIGDMPLPIEEAEALAERLIADNDERISSKWGPAGAIPTLGHDGKKGWLFFGWASA